MQSVHSAALWRASGDVTAAVGNGRDEEMAIIEELLRLGRMPGAGVLKEGSVNLADTLREIHGL